MKKWFLPLWLYSFQICAQVLKVTPSFPTTDDTVTIIYNAQLGNGALAEYTEEVFAHTGLLTAESTNGNDWKHVVGNWATYDSTTLMEFLGNDLYRIQFHIRSFYGVEENEEVTALAFVFRNENGSIVGRAEDNSDIFYPVNLQVAGDFLTYSFTGSALTVEAENASIRLQPFLPHVIKVSLLQDSPSFPDTSFSVVLPPSYPDPTLVEFNDHLEFGTDSLKVLIEKFPVRLVFIYHGDTLTRDEAGLTGTANSGGVRLRLHEGESLYGTGSRAIDYDKRGKKFGSYNTAQYGYSNGASVLNVNIPLVISSRLYGLYMDNFSPGEWDLGNADSGVLSYSAESGSFSYFFVAGHSNEALLDYYTQLTGRQPLPPRWALGYIQSRFGYQNETEARNMVTLMRDADFPMDALVLDLYWFGSPSTMGNLDWDESKWPTHEDMISDFSEVGINTILITEPYITQNSSNFSYTSSNGLLGTDVNGDPFVIGNFWAGSAGLLDLFASESQNWMWDFYEAQINQGIRGWWCDLGEPENHPSSMVHSLGPARAVHNVYSLIWAEMLFKKMEEKFPQQRLFNLIRSGYAGMQRYSTFPWSGDIQRSFDGLKAQIPILLSMGMSGVGYMHSDIGGFTGGGQNEELYTRWQQLGAFAPVMRAHGEGAPSEPVYYSATCQNNVRKMINLRYQLTPYNYSLAYQHSVKGTPLARPINFYEPGNVSLANINDQFLWGENLLVAPVLNQGATMRPVVFPSGKWISFSNATQVFNGGSLATVNAALETLPLFVKAGSFVPMVPLTQTLAAYNTDTLQIRFYPDLTESQSAFTLYDDDGADPLALGNENYELIRMEASVNWNQISIHVSKSGNGFSGAPAMREMNFHLYRVLEPPAAALLNGVNVPLVNSINELNAADSAVYFDGANNLLYVRYRWWGNNTTLDLIHPVLSGTDGELVLPAQNLEVFPNPASSSVLVFVESALEEPATLNSYSLDGQKIFSEEITLSKGRNEIPVAVAAWSPGVYLLKLQSKAVRLFAKIVKQ